MQMLVPITPCLAALAAAAAARRPVHCTCTALPAQGLTAKHEPGAYYTAFEGVALLTAVVAVVLYACLATDWTGYNMLQLPWPAVGCKAIAVAHSVSSDERYVQLCRLARVGLHAYCVLDLVLPKSSHAAASSNLPLLRQVSLLLGPGCSVKHGTRLKTGKPDSWLLHLKP